MDMAVRAPSFKLGVARAGSVLKSTFDCRSWDTAALLKLHVIDGIG